MFVGDDFDKIRRAEKLSSALTRVVSRCVLVMVSNFHRELH